MAANVRHKPYCHRQRPDLASTAVMGFANLVAPLSLALTMVVCRKGDSATLHAADFGLLVSFCILFVADVLFVIVQWSRRRFWGLVPLGALVVAAGVSDAGARFAYDREYSGTPLRPRSFLCGQTKGEFTEAAKLLLGKGFKTVRIEHPAEACMIAGLERKEVPVEALEVLRKYGFQSVRVDDRQSIVVFGYYHPRSWYEYTWAKNGLLKPLSLPTSIWCLSQFSE